MEAVAPLSAVQGPLNGSGPPPSWRELTRLARCARGANQTVMVRCGRLGAIQAAAPTVFRYCCARGMQNPPAAPAIKLQRFESLRLLKRLDIICSKSNAPLAQCCADMHTSSDSKLGDSPSWNGVALLNSFSSLASTSPTFATKAHLQHLRAA